MDSSAVESLTEATYSQMNEERTLTPDQRDAMRVITDRISLGVRQVKLTGWAGTGKTFLTQELVRQLSDHWDVYACAPTHKAAKVLGSKLPIETSTIHSFLNLQMVPDGQGDYTCVQKNKKGIPESGIVVLDEASMIGEKIWKYIEKTKGLQWIFVGDPGQLPPVNEKPSPALHLDGAHLDSIVRQAKGNPILRVATAAREGRNYFEECEHGPDGGAFVTGNSTKFLRSAVDKFKGWDQTEAPDSRVLAYRNSVVNNYNTRIRTMLYGTDDLPRFVEGDWLMMRQTYFDPETKESVLKNSEEVRVLDVDSEKRYTVGGGWETWALTVQAESGAHRTIPILHESEKKRFNKQRAIEKQKGIKSDNWTSYYKLIEFFADASYAFAMTVHKSQGSTFDTAYVDHRDLMHCKRKDERKALCYVAFTRPSHNLAILV